MLLHGYSPGQLGGGGPEFGGYMDLCPGHLVSLYVSFGRFDQCEPAAVVGEDFVSRNALSPGEKLPPGAWNLSRRTQD